MKKYLSGCFALAVILMCFTVSVSAAKGVTESPNVKIVIDGQIGTYKNPPISLNGRTLLPLKEILVNLGVQDDNEHIQWNSAERSVTIVKDSQKLYLKIGSDKATVDSEEVVLDAAPIIYKDKTYIPVKFVAQSLGKKVIWDGSSKSVLIRDEEQFNHIKDILVKSDAAMKAIKDCKMNLDASVDTKQGSMSYNLGINSNVSIDMLKKKVYLGMKMNMAAINMNMDMYLADGKIYMKNPLTNKWEKRTLEQSEYDKIFQQNNNIDIFDGTDALYAGLKEVKSENTNEILLEGDVFLGDLFKMAGQGAVASKVEFDKFNVKMSIDKNTYTLNSITMKLDFHSTDGTVKGASAEVKCDYTDYNSNVDIAVPEDVVKNAVENSDLKFSLN